MENFEEFPCGINEKRSKLLYYNFVFTKGNHFATSAIFNELPGISKALSS